MEYWDFGVEWSFEWSFSKSSGNVRMATQNSRYRQNSRYCRTLDGCQAHWGLDVRASLNERFPNRWIGRVVPTPSPKCSQDITQLNFFLWGFVKTKVFKAPVYNLQDLKDRITQKSILIDNICMHACKRFSGDRKEA